MSLQQEDFIQDIYNKSFIIESFKECIYLLNTGRATEARVIYNNAAAGLERLLTEISSFNNGLAGSIQRIALNARDSYEDKSLVCGILNSELIPELYKYVSAFANIDVTENRYRLISSKTGFLTAMDHKTGLYIHDPYDPMWEAYQTASRAYKPEMKSYAVFGCGMGYLIYQLWYQSKGAIKIYVYEDDEAILEYAYRFGVLSLVPQESVHIIRESNCEKLALCFIDFVNSDNENSGFYFSPYKKKDYDGLCDGELNRIIINNELSSEIHDLTVINLWKNTSLSGIPFSSVKKRFSYDEWVVIAAGPSLDSNIQFIKESKGKRGLIAVNTVLRRLCKENIIPDVVAAADASDSLSDHIMGLEDYSSQSVLIADWLVSWKYTERFRGPICFVKTISDLTLTKNIAQSEPIWEISGTVSCLALEAAVKLGASQIYLVGQDLAYPEGRKYASDMPHEEKAADQYEIRIPSVDGKMVDTCESFIWFKRALEHQIEKYDSVRFINMSNNGAIIEGTENLHP